MSASACGIWKDKVCFWCLNFCMKSPHRYCCYKSAIQIAWQTVLFFKMSDVANGNSIYAIPETALVRSFDSMHFSTSGNHSYTGKLCHLAYATWWSGICTLSLFRSKPGLSNLNQPRAAHLSVRSKGGPHEAKLGEIYSFSKEFWLKDLP